MLVAKANHFGFITVMFMFGFWTLYIS
jgi:hypothetical protein